MMDPISKRYAKALFQLADEKNILQEIKNNLFDFSSLVKENKLLGVIFDSIQIYDQETMTIMDIILKDQAHLVFINFVKLLVQKHRQKHYENIVAEYNRLFDRKMNRIHTKCITAFPLEEKMRETILQSLSKIFNAEIIMKSVHDSRILGGLVLEIEDKIFDNSLRRKLINMRQNLQSRQQFKI